SWTQKQQSGARTARRAARRVRHYSGVAARAVAREDPRATTRAFAKLEEAEKILRAGVAASPFVDAYSWAAVDLLMQGEKLAGRDSQQSAEHAVAMEARIASAIETCTQELEAKLEHLLQSFGATAP
ncbi:MAG TPA: hypothetical protein VEX18_22120, partial [Polyangiaceae bacterium]|nr:hypothetical protein [Polyangiaceae bacterium]